MNMASRTTFMIQHCWNGARRSRARTSRGTIQCMVFSNDAFSSDGPRPARVRDGVRDGVRDRGGQRERSQRGRGGSDRRNERYGRDDRRGGGGRHQNDRYERNYDRNSINSNQDRKPSKLEFQGDTLYGSSPVLAALDANRRVMHALYIQEGIGDSKKKELPAIRQALSKAEKMKIPLVETSKHDLNMATNNRPHQGIVLDASPLNCEKLDVMPPADVAQDASKSLPIWLCLDEITDPQNLGAVLRTAYFLGASGVLLCSKNSAPLSGVVSKASSGALEKMTLYSCRSLPTTLMDAKSKGWDLVAACGDDDSTPCQDFQVTAPTILVLGSEGYGLRKMVRNACNRAIRVDRGLSSSSSPLGVGGLMDVESLNVSVATGILLHSLLTSRNGRPM